MTKCEKCGRVLDDEYAKEWRWCTECREKLAPTGFGCCELCGTPLAADDIGGVCKACLAKCENDFLVSSKSQKVEPEKANTFAFLLKLFGFLIILLGAVMGIGMAKLSGMLALTYGFAIISCGILFMGVGEIIRLLHQMTNKWH